MGSIHRNSYVDSPRLLGAELELRGRPTIRLAGQITGVEGYIESTAIGLLVATFVHARLEGREPAMPPKDTALGALHHHLTRRREKGEPFSPMNINFGLLPPLTARAKKSDRRAMYAERAKEALGQWIAAVGV